MRYEVRTKKKQTDDLLLCRAYKALVETGFYVKMIAKQERTSSSCDYILRQMEEEGKEIKDCY